MKNETELFSREEQCRHIVDQYSDIIKHKREHKWDRMFRNISNDDILSDIFDEDSNIIYDKLLRKVKELSSGQLNYIYSLTALLANIRFDSLLLFDEPEQHLHPKAITNLMSVLFEILQGFESYAIICTHSPLIIRELISENVYIFRREEDYLSVSNIDIESFGEDISVLNDKIFGDADQEKRYEKFINDLVSKGESYNEILSNIESNKVPLGLKAKLYIRRSIIKRQNENA